MFCLSACLSISLTLLLYVELLDIENMTSCGLDDPADFSGVRVALPLTLIATNKLC